MVQTVYDAHFDNPKTKRGMRTIPIGVAAVELLTARRPDASDVGALIFAKREGTPLNRWSLLRKDLKSAARKSGFLVSLGIS